MRTSRRIPGAAVVVAMVIAVAGCNSNEPITSEVPAAEAAAFAVPTLAQVKEAVALDDDQAALVQTALRAWNQAGRGDGEDGPFARHRAGMEFVATVAPALDNEELSDLVDFLVAFREQQRERMRSQDRDRAGRRDGDPDGHWARLVESLGLTAQQRTAMEALHQEMRSEMHAQREAFRSGSITEEQLAAAMERIRETRRTRLASILTEEQLAKHDQLREQRMEQRRERRLEPMGARFEAHVEWLSAVLGLDDVQKAQVAAVLEPLIAERKASFEALCDGTQERDQVRLHLRESRDAVHEALAGILTEEQAARLEIVHRLRPRWAGEF